MKRLFQILLTLIVVFSFSVVHAAYAYTWTVDGENLRRDGTAVKNGTAKWVESDEYTGGILVLDHYNGGQIKIACYGTGMGHVFAVQLIGDNTITVDRGVGVLANAPVVFIGDGTLTIKAAVPVGSSMVKNADNTLTEIEKIEFAENTVLKITPSKVEVPAPQTEETKEEVKEEDKKEEEKTEDKKDEEEENEVQEPIPASENGINKTVYLIGISCIVVVLLLVAFIIMRFNKKRK